MDQPSSGLLSCKRNKIYCNTSAHHPQIYSTTLYTMWLPVGNEFFHIYIHAHTHTHKNIYADTNTGIYVCIYKHTNIHTYIHTYIYTYVTIYSFPLFCPLTLSHTSRVISIYKINQTSSNPRRYTVIFAYVIFETQRILWKIVCDPESLLFFIFIQTLPLLMYPISMYFKFSSFPLA
jgi:hypothetical protein